MARIVALTLITLTLTAALCAQGEPLTLIAAERDGRINLGGVAMESAWDAATPLAVPIETEVIHHPPLEVTLRALVDNSRLFLRVEWPDASEDADCWLWTLTEEGWERSHDRDDGLQIVFDSPEGVNDQWNWWAQRTDAVGVAQDMVVSGEGEAISDPGQVTWRANAIPDHNAPAEVWVADEAQGAPRPSPGGWVARSENHLFEGHTEPLGETNPWTGEPWAQGDTVPGVIGIFPAESQSDVETVGTWHDGRWTLEIRRALVTGDAEHDVILRRGQRWAVTLSFMGSEPEIAPIALELRLP
jgi:Ethylbenzene dehydrogenase